MNLSNLKQQFEESSDNKMSLEEFQILVLIYPIFLVANADNKFDEEEKFFIKGILLNFLEPLYKNELSEVQYNNLIDNFLSDLKFLQTNQEKFKNNFLETIKSFDVEIRKSISELLNDVANASGGLSVQENIMIKSIKNDFLKL
jgi:uncharacterized tellurite resistance protein B-like protein